VAEDPRFLVGVNLDGTLPAALAGGWHLDAPFLWLQSDGQQLPSYLQARDRLLAGVSGSELLIVGGTSHTSFTDESAYLSPLGRALTGDDGSPALVAATTGDLIAAFVAGPLAGPGDPMAQVLARHPNVKRARCIRRERRAPRHAQARRLSGRRWRPRSLGFPVDVR